MDICIFILMHTYTSIHTHHVYIHKHPHPHPITQVTSTNACNSFPSLCRYITALMHTHMMHAHAGDLVWTNAHMFIQKCTNTHTRTHTHTHAYIHMHTHKSTHMST